MSKIKHTLNNFEEDDDVKFLDEQYHYKQYLKDLEYDSRRQSKTEQHDNRLWTWPSDNQ